MLNEKTILTRLQNGENIEDITKEITSIINSANKTYKKETVKIQELENIIKLMGQWLNFYYNVPFEDIKASEMITFIETTLDSAKSLDESFKLDFKKDLKDNKASLEELSNITINNFLKTMGW